jgi:hypothetical protein
MGKAGRQRRQKRDRQRRRAAQSGEPGAAFRAAPQPAPSQQELAAFGIAEALGALCDGNRADYEHWLDQLAIEHAPGWIQTVGRTLVGYLRQSVAAAWQGGWQPAELVRQVGRELSAAHAAVMADLIVAEMAGYAAAAVDPRWAAQVAVIEAAAPGKGAWWGSDAEYLSARYALGRDAEFIITVGTVLETQHIFHHLPAIEKLLPLPGTARPSAPAAAAATQPADERMLGRIRALLAKAESTEFAEEAEALSARAQELMAKYSIDHALLAAESGQTETPGGRRIAVDNPYEAPKATLLQTVALANRCRVVWSKAIGLVTVIGFPADIDAVELLFTSLLVQANTAMLRAGAKQDAYGRSRTRAFRTSFLVSYAIRIGERLAAAADSAEADAVAEHLAAAGPATRATGGGAANNGGTDLVPFLAARHRAVDDAVDEMFGDGLTKTRTVRATDAEGWTSGRAAADLASLRSREEVNR